VTALVEGINESRLAGKRGTPALLCWPKAAGTYATVIILHERYGLVPHTEDLARKIAAEGFVVLAPDLFFDFPDQVALHKGDVGVKPTDDAVREACEDVFPLFNDVTGADTARFGMIGVCQTGRYPLVWGAHHPIKAAITLYGAAQAADWEYSDRHPDGIDKLLDKMVVQKSTNILGIFGEGDHVISVEDVLRLRNAIEQRNLSYQISIYPSVPHGWLNDTMPGRYRPKEAKAAWDETIAFLKEKLAPGANGDDIVWTFRSAKSTAYDFTKNVRYE
jgi:carboxymethylenebutenolidase